MDIYSILESVPLVRKGMGTLAEDKQKNRGLHAFVVRVCRAQRNKINSVL